MCESNAYLLNDKGDDELLLEDVVKVLPESGQIRLTDVVGDEKVVAAEIDHIDLLKHRIVLRPL